MKKVLLVTLCLALSVSVGVVSAKEKVTMDDISKKYEVGDVISKEDVKVIMAEANLVDTKEKENKEGDVKANSTSNWNIFGSARNSNNTVEMDVTGSATVDIGFIGGTLSGRMKAYTVKGNVTKAGIHYHFDGYGIDSYGAYHKTEDIDVDGNGAGSSYEKTWYREFSSSVSAWDQSGYGFGEYSGGSLDIPANFTQQ
jgi:hypothetical protein